jgi:hypothetical protein
MTARALIASECTRREEEMEKWPYPFVVVRVSHRPGAPTDAFIEGVLRATEPVRFRSVYRAASLGALFFVARREEIEHFSPVNVAGYLTAAYAAAAYAAGEAPAGAAGGGAPATTSPAGNEPRRRGLHFRVAGFTTEKELFAYVAWQRREATRQVLCDVYELDEAAAKHLPEIEVVAESPEKWERLSPVERFGEIVSLQKLPSGEIVFDRVASQMEAESLAGVLGVLLGE